MTPAEIKAAYKASLETLATLTATKDVAEAAHEATGVAYHAALTAVQTERKNNQVLKLQLDACIADGSI